MVENFKRHESNFRNLDAKTEYEKQPFFKKIKDLEKMVLYKN